MFSFLKQKHTKKKSDLFAYVSGRVIPIEEVKDGVFSEKILGDGLAILPEEDILCAPCDGEIVMMMKESGHACGIRLENGIEILLHIGLDTVDMQGSGFRMLVEEHDRVKRGQELIQFDREKIREAGCRDEVILVVPDTGSAGSIQIFSGQYAYRGETKVMQIE